MAKPRQHKILNRREFLRMAAALGGTSALAVFLEACSKAGIEVGMPLAPTETRKAAAKPIR